MMRPSATSLDKFLLDSNNGINTLGRIQAKNVIKLNSLITSTF